MKKFNLLVILLPLFFLVSCTNLDEIYNRLGDHEDRIKSLEAKVKEANTSISNLQKLLDAQAQRISIVTHRALEDGSGYVLVMSDGSEITLKNGKDGNSPLIGVLESDGVLYWTINGVFMLDANGNKIKAEGKDGTAGVTPKLRVNADGYWEVSVDGGKKWTLVLDTDGNPVQAIGKDATVDLTITETENAIIITYNGQTFTIYKKKPITSTVYKVVVPSMDAFNESKILRVMNPENTPVAEICLEYIKSTDIAKQMMTIYSVKENATDISSALSLEDGGRIQWNIESNTCTYTAGTSSDISEVYVDANGTFSITTDSEKVVETNLVPLLLEDVRGEEINKYALVKIGTQYWMAENLRTIYYTDGTAITTGLNKEDWLANTDGAVTAYDGNNDNIATMGALYNWYAVTHTKGLAPQGFRVTSDKDWAIMAKYMDPENYYKDETGARESETIAPLLKSIEGWNDDGNGNNLSGLNVFPCGSTSESKYMDYSGKGRQAYFWTSTSYETKTAMFRRLYYDENFTNRWYEKKSYGYSVRCIKEN